ncbi:hypothetical protein MLD52_20670 [Puniceicoccaceae bacterium K14]|nr:hypothetical protein [Puniceicoccaceae bacterium K14]
MMIRPAKHLDLNTCVLRTASIMLSKLQSVRVCTYTDLRASLSVLGEDADVAFVHAIHLLFLLGRIDYHAQTDSFEYINSGKML